MFLQMCLRLLRLMACYVWENAPEFNDALEGNPIRILTFKEIVDESLPSLNQTVAATEVGRILQLFKASGVHF